MDKVLGIKFSSKIIPVKPVNEQFTLCKCYVMAIGKNQNKSNILKEAVDDAMPSLFNIPVVGHLYVDDKGEYRMGGHDVTLKQNENGKYEFKAITVPFGTVPAQDGIHFEEVQEANGTLATYLVADIILWTGRYPELLESVYSDEIYFSQSMEIIPKTTHKEDGYTVVEKYQYSALCLLGKSDDYTKNISPCFPSCRVEPYDFSANKEEWNKLYEEFKFELGKLDKSLEQNKKNEGGKTKMDSEMIAKILIEFGIAEQAQLSFEITEDMTEEEFRAKLSESFSGQSDGSEGNTDSDDNTAGSDDNGANNDQANFDDGSNGDEGNPSDDGSNNDDQDANGNNNGGDGEVKFAVDLTAKEKFTKACTALREYDIWDSKNYVAHYLLDMNDKYLYVERYTSGEDVPEEKLNFRVPYEIADDNISIHMEQKETVRLVWVTKEDEEKLEQEKAAFAELKKYKEDRIEDDKKKAYSAVISEFSEELAEIDEYKAVVRDAMTFESVDALTEKLYALRGKYNTGKREKKPLRDVHIPVGFSKKSNSEMDAFMEKYLPKQ